MSPKRKTTISEFERYTPAARLPEEESPARGENGNAFPFDREFEPAVDDAFGDLPVIDTIKASLIYPDALQPRPSPLPQGIRARFRRYEIDAFGAAREWLKLAEKDPVVAHDVRRYRSMGENMAANGQINPITGRWEIASLRGVEKRIFRIETGEQRFWSAVLHHTAEKRIPDDLTLRVSVVPGSAAPTEIATVRRQISENRKNMQLTEVLQAREIARLLLAAIAEKTGQTFAVDASDEYEYFRAALRLGRVPRGVWEGVQEEFRLTQHRMRQSLDILHFPSNLLDLAHSARLSYRTLNAILKGPEDTWAEAVRAAALQAMADEDDDESAPDTAGAATHPGAAKRPKQPVDPAELAYRGVRRFYRSAIKGSRSNPLLIESVADNVIMDGYAEEVVDFMGDLIRAIRQRLEEEQEF
jgi:hypothetical protein